MAFLTSRSAWRRSASLLRLTVYLATGKVTAARATRMDATITSSASVKPAWRAERGTKYGGFMATSASCGLAGDPDRLGRLLLLPGPRRFLGALAGVAHGDVGRPGGDGHGLELAVERLALGERQAALPRRQGAEVEDGDCAVSRHPR